MAIERHLILQELTLRPSGEWTPPMPGWTMARVAEGVGYWLHGGSARELKPGDGFAVAGGSSMVLRASQLGPLKLEFFLVQPQFLNGLITVTEGHQLEQAGKNSTAQVFIFAAAEPLGQKFTRLVAQTQRENLPARSALLQLWSQAVAGALTLPLAADHGQNLRGRFRQLVAQMPDAELARHSLTELAGQLHCSERHFSRLFREEFGVPLRTRQTELRLQRALQLLADANAKIINVAYESGYRHLGLFNAMFKKRFGATPSEWRQKNFPAPQKNFLKRAASLLVGLLALAGFFSASAAVAQTTNVPGRTAGSATNAGPKFKVEKYQIAGNSILPPEKLGEILTNVPAAFGTNVTFTGIRAALGDLQMAYRERGFVTVSVGLPPQKLTNATVKIKVTEGRLDAITVKGNHHYSTENVLRALPSLHTNMLLNSHVFQRELDTANANRNRQIYPIIGPGLEPGTSELTLKVKDRLPLHGRVEINNQATPGTPDSRVAFNAQYDNLWQLEHQAGVQYTFSPVNFGGGKNYYFSPLDLPFIASYSGYYRLPLGRPTAVQQQIDSSGGRFGYNEITHQFQMPAPSGRPEITAYATRSVSDTGVQLGELKNVVSTPLLTIDSQDAGQNVSLNEGIGAKLSLPLPALGKLASTFSLGLDFKRYQQVSFNTNNFYAVTVITNASGSQTISQTIASPQPARRSDIEYFPVNIGFSGSVPDSWGTTFFNVLALFNVATVGKMSQVAYTTNASDNYAIVQLGASREQRLYKDWTMLLRADGQWTDGPLFSNERYAMGGAAGVRGFSDGAAYGDTGWRVMVEPRTPLVNIGMVDGDIPFWVRGSVFLDYGQISALNPSPGVPGTLEFMGAGFGVTANIGNHIDARLTVAWPLMNPFPANYDNGLHFYFGAGAQF